MLKQKEKIDKSTWLTTTGQRARYYIGDLARTCEGAIITTFMTMFLLMQGIHPGKMAAITLFVKIIDSFDDVIFGFLIDRIKIKGSKIFAVVQKNLLAVSAVYGSVFYDAHAAFGNRKAYLVRCFLSAL